MFGHDGDDFDEELMAHDRFLLLANDMYQDHFSREDVMQKLMSLNVKREHADRICRIIEEKEKQRKLLSLQRVTRQRHVRGLDRRDGEERKIGISRILDTDDYSLDR